MTHNVKISHPDQTVVRDPPMNFQDDNAREHYEDAVWFNEYAWVNKLLIK